MIAAVLAVALGAEGATPEAAAPQAEPHPWDRRVVVAIGVALTVLLILLGTALTELGRRSIVKTYYLWRSQLGVEVGLRGMIQLMLLAGLPAVAVAISQSLGKDHSFDWFLFWVVFITVTLAGVVSNIINLSTTLRSILSPRAGQVWASDRKVRTAGLLKALNSHLIPAPAPRSAVASMVTELLTIIVSHVRDFRGSHRSEKPDVFANLLIVDGDELIVVARDLSAHGGAYPRPIPQRYPKAAMLSGRAIESRTPLTVGDLTAEYADAPQNKPYRSILAIPLVASNDHDVVGALSIDSSRPYFFDSFRPGQIANDLENSLQPYIHLLMMILEKFVDPTPSALPGLLREGLKSCGDSTDSRKG